jgi:hypothetical protein
MPRPQKYKTEAERLQARREQHRIYNSKRSKKSNDNNDNNVNITLNIHNDNNDNNYKELKEKYETLQTLYEQLKYENSINCEYIEELQDKLDSLQDQGY